jgi:8-oxo-dGTP diphosphatase
MENVTISSMTTITTKYGKHLVTLTWVEADKVPDHLTPTSAHGFCFFEPSKQAILVNVDSRGWDIPGGKVDPGESPEVCFAREVLEEANIIGAFKMIGYVIVDNRADPNRTPNHFPDFGLQVFYRLDANEILPFMGDYEIVERAFVNLDEVPTMHNNWTPIFEAIYAKALDPASRPVH